MALAIKVSITVIEGDDRGKSFILSKPATVVGRARGDIRLSDKKISSEHLCLKIEDSQLTLEDLGSTNGTSVNGRRIDKSEVLHNLDEISLGFSKIRVNIVENLDQFRKSNAPHISSGKSKKTVKKNDETAIDQLINDELKRFSKWDLNQERDSVPSFNEPLQLPKVTLELHIMEGPEKGRKIPITKGNVVLGRGKADISLRDTDISRNHASIESFAANQIFIRDMASTNGTYLNKKRVSYAKLGHGDLIQMGSTVMKLVIGSKDED